MRQPLSSYGFGCVVLLTLLFWICACTRNVVAQVGAVASAGGVTAVAQVPDFGVDFNAGSFVPQVPFFNGGQQRPFPRRPPPPHRPPPGPPHFDYVPGNGFNGYGPPFNPNINGFLQNMPFGNIFPNFQYPNQPQWNNNNQFPHRNQGHHQPHPNRQQHHNQQSQHHQNQQQHHQNQQQHHQNQQQHHQNQQQHHQNQQQQHHNQQNKPHQNQQQQNHNNQQSQNNHAQNNNNQQPMPPQNQNNQVTQPQQTTPTPQPPIQQPPIQQPPLPTQTPPLPLNPNNGGSSGLIVQTVKDPLGTISQSQTSLPVTPQPPPITHESLKIPPGAFIYPDSYRYVHIPDTNTPTEIDPRR